MTARKRGTRGAEPGTGKAEPGSGSPEPELLARALTAWLPANARPLPWRHAPAGARDPYLVLVSEAMLQQTQVSRVLERYDAFLKRFPTVEALSAAAEDDVLAEWSGMGYYRRARSLHAAARMICGEFGGKFPRDPAQIRRLPGVGRYTAGAIASMAFGLPEPIVDGNVARVLLRVHGRDAASDDKSVQPWLWAQAAELAASASNPGAANEAMMELGATVCIPPPAMPRCGVCPLKDRCVARREGRQLEIPRPKARAAKSVIYCGVAVIEREDGALLVEQRPRDGLWGGMWQAPTVESTDAPPTAKQIGGEVGVSAAGLKPEAAFEHQTTHRRVIFQVWRGQCERGFAARRGLWMTAAKIERLALSNPQRRILLETARGGTLWT